MLDSNENVISKNYYLPSRTFSVVWGNMDKHTGAVLKILKNENGIRLKYQIKKRLF